MAKHPVPKRRATHARKSRRHAVFLTKAVKRLKALVSVSKKGQVQLPHRGASAAPSKKPAKAIKKIAA